MFIAILLDIVYVLCVKIYKMSSSPVWCTRDLEQHQGLLRCYAALSGLPSSPLATNGDDDTGSLGAALI